MLHIEKNRKFLRRRRKGMIRGTGILGVFLALGLLFGNLSHAEAEPAPTSENTRTTFQLLDEGFYASRKEAGIVVAEGADALERLYKEDISSAKRPPVMVDFDRCVVVAIFAGERSSGGYRLEITGARYENKELNLRYRLHVPKPGSMVTQALTSPYAVILLEKTEPSR